MKKTVLAFSIFLMTALIPALVYADQTQIDDAAISTQIADESQVIVIVNPTPEQILSADEQILSSDTTKEIVKTDDPSLGEEDVDGLESIEELKGPTFDIPVTLNEKVERYIHFFTNGIREKFSTWLARSEIYLPMMKRTFKEKGLPEDLTYLALIESGFNNKAYSRAKAAGQWQFIKGTGKRYGLRIDKWIDERRDPEKATVAAAHYLSDLYVRFNDWHLAAASYNAGEGKIGRAIIKYKTVDFWELSQKKNRYLRTETKDYVPKLIAAAMIAKEPAKYGFDDIASFLPLVYEKVSINRIMDLREIAKATECDPEELRVLNPELKTNFTPPNYPGYELKVAIGMKTLLEERMASIATVSEKVAMKECKISNEDGHKRQKTSHRKLLISYVVKEGDTLWEIAAKYNVQTKLLSSWNNLLGRTLKKGDKLKIYVVKASVSGKKLS